MIFVRYTMAQDPSGYGQAARAFVQALVYAGINVSVEPIKQMPENSDYGIAGNLVDQLANRKIPYKVKIIHLTPDIIPQYQEHNVYTIAHLFWECDQLPKGWIKPLQEVDEIWTASEPMATMIKNSGVTTRCETFPQPIDTIKAYEKIDPFTIPDKKAFVFYAMFQWINRKNPRGLIEAFLKEFEDENNVALLLKTYRTTYLPQEHNLIIQDIAMWKKLLNQKTYPPIYLVNKIMNEKDIWRFHQLGDCFINPSSGEGWCRPMAEAMLLGKPVISGNNGGITDIMDSKYYFKVTSAEKIVSSQPFIPWYVPPMRWKELDESSLRKAMRNVYSNTAVVETVSQAAKTFVVNNFSLHEVGKQMRERLKKIYDTL